MGAHRSTSLSPRAKLTLCAHIFKALFRQHHKEIIPLVKPYINTDSVVIDVGGHAGQMMKLFSGLAPKGHVICFEPGAYARKILKNVIGFKRLQNVTLVSKGLSNASFVGELVVPIKKSGSIGFGRASVGGNIETDEATMRDSIELITLDDYVRDNNIQKLDFIKVDIEGHEMHMLEGAEETIKRFKPTIMVEIVDRFLQKAGSSAGQVISLLEGHGYRYKRIKDYGNRDGDYLFFR